jgi:predicted Zn-dependent protease
MVYLYWSVRGPPAHEGRTVFSRRGGGTRSVTGCPRCPLTLRSDPFAPGIECSPFAVHEASGEASSVFDNGLPLEPTDWIRDGELNALITSRYAATQTGLPLTPGIGNLLLSGSGATGSVEDLVAGTDRGLLLTCLWYIREVDPQSLLLTGLTRDGVYLVEGGEVVGEVTNFRFNESPVDLLGRVDGVTESTRTMPAGVGRLLHPRRDAGLRVRDFNMSSTSDAS